MLAPTSFWNQALPESAPIDPKSATYVGSLAAGINNLNFLYRERSITTFWASERTPTQRVWLDLEDGTRPKLRAALAAVPVPPGLRPPGPFPGDQECMVCCPRSDGSVEYFEFHGMRHTEIDGARSAEEVPECTTLNEPGWHCIGATAVKSLRESPGYVTNGDWPGGIDFGAKGLPLWGCSASKTIEYQHTIKVAEAQQLYIPHALRFAVPRSLHQAEYRWPAVASDGESTNPGHPVTGCIFRFDPSDDFADVPDPFVKAVCVAIRDYGLCLTDSSGKTGNGAALKCESLATMPRSQAWGRDAWKGKEDKFGSPGAILSEGSEGTPENETAPLGNQIPLARLLVLDSSYTPSKFAAGSLPAGTTA
jgi:hypothetical protein